MTATNQLPVVLSNNSINPTTATTKRALVDFERSILNHLRDATKPWFAIAQEFLDASEQLQTSAFKELCEKVRLSYSTARKLIKVAKSSRLRNYADRLASIDAWSTLHEIAKLDASSFDALAAEYLETTNDVRVLMRSDVERFNAKKTKTSESFASFFTVQVSSSTALSTSDEQFLATTAKTIQECLPGKIKIVWHVEQPTITSRSSVSVV